MAGAPKFDMQNLRPYAPADIAARGAGKSAKAATVL